MSNILNKIKLSGVTYDIVDSSAIHSLDGYATEAYVTAATEALAESIAEQNYATTGYVQEAIAEASGVTTGQVQTMIDESISGKVDTSTYTAYTASTNTTLGGKLDTSVFQTYSGDTNTALASKFAGAVWNSNDKKIYFYDNVSATGTALAYIDGTDFVKDGFLSSVTIDNRTIEGQSVPCLVFIWNTDAGIQETDIPISGIFDPTNYVSVDVFTAYTASTSTVIGGKADTTAVTQSISEATSGKADTTAVTAVNNALTAHTASTTVHVTSSDKSTWNGKQDALVSGTNIKTVGGNSLLGSGNIAFPASMTAEVSGTTLIFS